MPKVLTEAQIASFERDGYVCPVRLFSAEDAAALRQRFHALEETTGAEAQSRYRIKAHLPFPWLSDLIRHPTLVDVFEDLAGPDVIVWGSSWFTKKAHDIRFISWHQDSTYYGIEPPESITAWIALSPARRDSGCMRVIPGSHLGDAIVPHVETYDPNNLLSRGQTIEGVDESKARFMELWPGECSIHHNKLFHASEPNTTDDMRIGFAIHIAPAHCRQAQFDNATATVVRGRDPNGYWQPEPYPRHDFDPECLEALDAAWKRYRTGMKSMAQGAAAE
jgi:hypothetical protein